MTPVIALGRVARRFPNGTLALRDCSLAVGRGEFVTLLGPSGCGKSTVLRLISGLDRPSEGTVRVDTGAESARPGQHGSLDEVVGGAGARGAGRSQVRDPDAPGAGRSQVRAPDVPGRPAAPAISFVFQEPTLMPWATVFDNVWLPRRLAGQSRQAARADVDAVLARVGLDGFASAYPRELSGGMKMRVSIARALVSHPRVLLMDEPFAALDEITRERLNDDLLDWCGALNLTVVFVTHSVFEAVYLSRRVLVMGPRPGRIVDELTVDEPCPRGEAFRTSERYAMLCARGSRALRAAGGYVEDREPEGPR